MSKPSTPGDLDRPRSTPISVQGSRPASQQQMLDFRSSGRHGTPVGTPKLTPPGTPGTPLASRHASRNGMGTRTGGASDGALSLLATKLIQKFRAAFGSAAADLQGQEIITQEVLAVMKKGVSVKEEDLQLIQNRIRARLVGGTPVKNTLAENKRAIHAGDEWANIYQFNIAEGNELDRALAVEEKERQMRVRNMLNAQKQELADKKRAEMLEEQGYANQEKAAYLAWQKQEEERAWLQQEIARKLKEERIKQLEDKCTRRQKALASKRADEDEMAARLAYETKYELDKEEEDRLAAKAALKQYLLQNEANKAIKQQAKEALWEEDAYYKKAWEEVLDKQERERTERLNRNMARQIRTAEYAESGKLAEYKKWMDPAIIEKHWKDREAALDKDDAARKAKLIKMRQDMQQRLEEQIKERERARMDERRQEEALGRKVLAKALAEEEQEKAKQAARQAAKMVLNADIKNQMKDNVAIKRYQPITAVERSLNKDLLDKVHDWKLTGSVDCTNSLKLPRHLRTTVKI